MKNFIDNYALSNSSVSLAECFVVNKDIQLPRYNFKDSINRLNNYLENLSKETKSKKPDLSYTQNKEIYIENYILNSIVNYANFEYKDHKIITQDNILHSIILKTYLQNKKLNKKSIIKNSINNKFQLTNQVRQSIKNINSEMDEAAKEFSKLFKTDTKNLQIL